MEYCIGYYHVDIVIVDLKIAIECDGDYWHGNPKFYPSPSLKQISRQNHDKRRNSFLQNRDWKILRFWEYDINTNLKYCVDLILNVIEERKRLFSYDAIAARSLHD